MILDRFRMTDRVAVVTGAGRGIGEAIALAYAEAGADVVVAARSVDQIEDTAKKIQQRGRRALAVQCDVTKRADLENLVESAISEFGRIDVLVTAAGVAGGGPVHLLPVEEWQRVQDINLKGTYLSAKAVLPAMIEQRSGSIITIASIEGLEGGEGASAYNASKGAVMLLMRNMAIDYGRKGIRVNAICPGFIDTPLMESVMGMPGLEEVRSRLEDAHQLGRFGTAEEIANAALFLASDEASFVTGHALVVDGGYTAGHRFGIGKLMGLDDD